MFKTRLDIYLSAHAAAEAALTASSQFQSDEQMVSAFTASGGLPADYPFWRGTFTNTLAQLQSMQTQPAPSLATKPATPATPAVVAKPAQRAAS